MMAAIIAALVSFVTGKNLCRYMEGTGMGALALTCVCIWNGFFNSIQVVCRERDIVKREHRNGMHISSYILAHMIYQAFLCLMQTVITIYVYRMAGVAFPHEGFIFKYFDIDIGITIFLITFSADMMSLMISCIAKSTTAAMTIMPFTLIFELLFSGSMFGLSDSLKQLTNLSIAKWGIVCFNSQAGFNSLPTTTVWNQICKYQNVEVGGIRPFGEFAQYIQEHDLVDAFCSKVGEYSQNADYVQSVGNILNCWLSLSLFALFFAAVALLFLERIDKDKR